MGTSHPLVRLGICIAVSTFAVGCKEHRQSADGDMFIFHWGVPLGVIAGGLLAVPFALWLMNRASGFRTKLWAWIFLLGGPIVAVLVGPTILMDHVDVSETEFYARHGIWWKPTEHHVRFADVRAVKLIEEISAGRRGRKNHDYFLDITYKGNNSERIPVGNLLRDALPTIATRLGEHQIAIDAPPPINR